MDEKAIHITQLSAENVLRLRAVRITPTAEGLVIIGGKNGAGKTSVLNSIAMALGGKRLCPEKPLRAGQSKGSVSVTLDNGFVVERRFTPNGDHLSVTAGGNPVASPQAVLNHLTGALTFDPLEFTRMQPAARTALLCDLTGLGEKLVSWDAKRKALYEERRIAKRDLDDVETILANLTPPGPNPPEALVSILALTEAIQAADAANHGKRNLALAAREAMQALADATNAVSLRESRVEELKAELKEATEAFEGALAALPALEGSAKAAQAKAEAKPFVDTAPIRDQINKAEATNAAFRHAEQYEDRAARARGLQAKVSAAAQSIDDLDEQKRRALADAKYPIVGLSLNDQGEILYDGIPFAQAAQSEQLRVSMAIGLAANPKLRVCLIRDGSLLDDDSLADLARMAGEADAQVWVERVGEDKRCSVIIENGEVKDATDGSTTEGVAGS